MNNTGIGTLTFAPGSAQTQTVSNDIADQTGSGGTGRKAGIWSITKNCTGTLILMINASIVQGRTSSLPGNISNSATVAFSQTTSGTYGGVISATGGVRTKVAPPAPSPPPCENDNLYRANSHYM